MRSGRAMPVTLLGKIMPVNQNLTYEDVTPIPYPPAKKPAAHICRGCCDHLKTKNWAGLFTGASLMFIPHKLHASYFQDTLVKVRRQGAHVQRNEAYLPYAAMIPPRRDAAQHPDFLRTCHPYSLNSISAYVGTGHCERGTSISSASISARSSFMATITSSR